MCPIWPLHLIILYLLALCPMWVLCQMAASLTAEFNPKSVTLHMDDKTNVNFTVTGITQDMYEGNASYLITSTREDLAFIEDYTYQIRDSATLENKELAGRFTLKGIFLGRANVSLTARHAGQDIPINNDLPVTIIRPERIIDTIFTSSVATFVSLIFINFGCAMHWPTVKAVVKKPIGPLIGMAGQFLFMPLMSFVLGLLIFPDFPEMRLGMFFTGVSPGGGASNIWTFILGGNLNLSLAMTTISTLASFAFMPAWLFSLGQVIFRDVNIRVPYTRIATFVIGLIVPMGIGLCMQRWTPRIAAFMVRILKGFSTILLLFIIIFAIVTNLYIFELFTWQIIVAGMGIPWLGYAAGYLLAILFRQPHADALAISIETGIQNTGISIFLLRFALSQPEADLTTVVPVSCAIMTPVPMMMIYIYQKIKGCFFDKNQHTKIQDEDNTPISESPEPIIISTINIDK